MVEPTCCITPGDVIAFARTPCRRPELVVTVRNNSHSSQGEHAITFVDDARETAVWTDEFDDTEYVDGSPRRIAP